MKQSNLTRSISSYIPPFEESGLNDLSEEYDSLGERKPTGNSKIHSPQSRKVTFTSKFKATSLRLKICII